MQFYLSESLHPMLQHCKSVTQACYGFSVTDFRRLCSSASGIKLINSDLQYKALWTECALRTQPDWRETLTPQPCLQLLLMTSKRGWRRIPSGTGPDTETLRPRTPELDLYDELCWQHNVNMSSLEFQWVEVIEIQKIVLVNRYDWAHNRSCKIHDKCLSCQLILTSVGFISNSCRIIIHAIIQQVSGKYWS